MICWRCHSNSVYTGSRLPNILDVKTRNRWNMVGIDMIRNKRIVSWDVILGGKCETAMSLILQLIRIIITIIIKYMIHNWTMMIIHSCVYVRSWCTACSVTCDLFSIFEMQQQFYYNKMKKEKNTTMLEQFKS